ncbi:MAG: MEDS domain-containing protein [Halorientalis sp.]
MTTSDPLGDRGSEILPEAVRTQFESADLGRHLASFYRTRGEQLAVATAFIGLGLERDELCLYFADDNEPDAVREYFETAGIDVRAHERAGRLRIESAADTYLDGGFSADETLRTLEDAVDEGTAAGHDGVRVLGENTWSFEVEGSFDRVLDFEVSFDERCRDVPVTALCQYSLVEFDDATIGKAVQTHEQIVYRGTLCENPYYVPPAEYFARGSPRENSLLMLEQLQELARARREIEAREQRLSVINRVLRHNIRNEMSVLLGHLELLLEDGHVDDAGRDSIETATAVAEEFRDLAAKAQYVERTLDEFEPRRFDAAEMASRVASRRSDVTVSVDTQSAATVRADPDVEIALEELLTSAAAAADDATPLSVSVRTDRDDRLVHIDVTGGEQLLPEGARHAIDSGRETKLQHCNGLAVWIARWLVEMSHGSLSYDAAPARDRIRVSLPAPPADA